MERTNPGYTEHLFRPVYELNTASIWLGGAVGTPFVNYWYAGMGTMNLALTVSGVMVAGGCYFASQAYPLLKRQLKLTSNKKTFINIADLRDKNQLAIRHEKPKKDKRRTYIGEGFVWGAEHAQRAFQVMDMDSTLSDVKLPFFLRPVERAMREETESLGGQPWIHGMGKDKSITTSEEAWYGHTLITGNVGTGKTTLLRLMSLNALHMGNVLIVIDPKDDKDWQESIKAEMKYLGMGDNFYHLHPAKQGKSARIPLLKNYTRITEIADRISPLMGSGGSSKAFQDFAYGIIYHTANALHYLGEPIRLTSIQKVIASDRKGLALRVMRKHFTDTLGDDWESKYAVALGKLDPDPLTAMAIFYNNGDKGAVKNKVVEGMIEFALHDEGHYTKMVVSLRPVLTALTATPLDDLLSPMNEKDNNEKEDNDPRPIVDLSKIMDSGGCIYVSLDSLTDSTSAGFISRLLLAEMAAIAGERYNKGVGNARRITIANDEVHASLENNDALLNILAQGRAARMQMILATQTVADLEAKSDEATASRFLGLCNNFMSMRTTDPKTQEYVASQFAKSSITQSQLQTATSSDTSTSIFEFGANHGERLMKQREDMFPAELLGQLPILQYVARLADGRKMKMRLPIIINDEPSDKVAPWI